MRDGARPDRGCLELTQVAEAAVEAPVPVTDDRA